MSKNNKSQNKPVYKFLWQSARYNGRYRWGKITFGMTFVHLWVTMFHIRPQFGGSAKNFRGILVKVVRGCTYLLIIYAFSPHVTFISSGTLSCSTPWEVYELQNFHHGIRMFLQNTSRIWKPHVVSCIYFPSMIFQSFSQLFIYQILDFDFLGSSFFGITSSTSDFSNPVCARDFGFGFSYTL